jgi:3-hydroxyacyl-[acyl-carrier-protein] dehydratase
MHSETTLRIPEDHPAFAGHFPGRPIVPGVLLLDATVHALAQLLRPATSGCQISAAKFHSPVTPGETLLISLDTTPAGSARFDISSDARKVATGTLVMQAAR